jgi:hypothetical protein
MGSWRILGYQYVAEDTRHMVEIGDGLDRKMAGERAERVPRGEGHLRCDQDHAPWSLACTGVVACLPMDLSSPSSLHEVLRRVVVVKGGQSESHAKAQSLVDGDLNAPTVAAARVLMFDDLLDEVEVQELEKRTVVHVAGTEAHVLVVSVGSCVR